MVSKYKSLIKEIPKHLKGSLTLIQRHRMASPFYCVEFKALTVGSYEASVLIVN